MSFAKSEARARSLYVDDNVGSPYIGAEGIVPESDLDVPGLRELAGNPTDRVRLPLQHGASDDALPAWIELK